MNMYELNKIGYSKLPDLSAVEIEDSINLIKQFLKNNPSKYYMMLNNDVHYYTLYTFKDGYKFKDMAAEIISVILSVSNGKIKSIEVSEDNLKMEFWMIYDDECHVFYLFDYAGGVIEV